jgi:hypothetical protein
MITLTGVPGPFGAAHAGPRTLGHACWATHAGPRAPAWQRAIARQSMAIDLGSLPAAKGELPTGESAPVVALTVYTEMSPELSLAT